MSEKRAQSRKMVQSYTLSFQEKGAYRIPESAERGGGVIFATHPYYNCIYIESYPPEQECGSSIETEKILKTRLITYTQVRARACI